MCGPRRRGWRGAVADKAPLSDMDASAAAEALDSMKLRNRESLSHVSSRNSRNTADAIAVGHREPRLEARRSRPPN